jgi:hypothetical protein
MNSVLYVAYVALSSQWKVYHDIFVSHHRIRLVYVGFKCCSESFSIGNDTLVGSLSHVLVNRSCSHNRY